MPGAGFAAGPCLFKDTMQLAAFTDNSFVLGHSAMLVNEGLPLYLVTQLEQSYDLADLTVGILGMAFKGESDDIRSSLSYKLKRILEFRAARGALHRPLRHGRRHRCCRSTRCSRGPTCSSSAPRTRRTATLRPTSPSSTSGTCSGKGTTV